MVDFVVCFHGLLEVEMMMRGRLSGLGGVNWLVCVFVGENGGSGVSVTPSWRAGCLFKIFSIDVLNDALLICWYDGS